MIVMLWCGEEGMIKNVRKVAPKFTWLNIYVRHIHFQVFQLRVDKGEFR